MKTSNYCTRLLAFTLLAGFVAPSTQAQKLSIAPELGLVHSLYRPADKSIRIDNSLKQNFGINFIVGNEKNWTASAGLFFVANGIVAKTQQQQETGSYDDHAFRHIQLPVNIGYKKKMGYGSLWVQGGINAGYCFNTERMKVVRDFGVSNEVIALERYKSAGIPGKELKHFDIGLNASLSYVMPFGLFGKVQYHHGLNRAELHSVGQIRRQFLSFNVGYIFKIK